MKRFKERLYNYETPPPDDAWSKIEQHLDGQNVIEIRGLRKRSKLFFYAVTAAASLFIIFLGSQFFNGDNNADKQLAQTNTQNSTEAHQDSVHQNQKILENIIKTPKEGKLLASNTITNKGADKKYLTVAGPEGQPVKISPKVATLIISADNHYPPKPVWNEKIDEWQQIMLNNTSSSTPAGLMELVESASRK